MAVQVLSIVARSYLAWRRRPGWWMRPPPDKDEACATAKIREEDLLDRARIEVKTEFR